jgi:DNA repair protein RadC
MQHYKLRIEDMAAEERPSSRLMSSGAASLSNAELLSIILKSGSVAENAINLSQRVLSQFDLKQLSAVNATQLMKIHGIKSGKAVQIVACFELARRLETFDSSSKSKINSPEDVYRRLYPAMKVTSLPSKWIYQKNSVLQRLERPQLLHLLKATKVCLEKKMSRSG